MKKMPPAELMALVANSSSRREAREAFKDLFEAYNSLVRGVIVRRGFRGDDVDELAQRVWKKIWIKAGQYRGGNFKAFLRTIASRTAISHHRCESSERRHRNRLRVLSGTSESHESPETTCLREEELYARDLEAASLRRVFPLLTPKVRRVAELKYVEGLSNKEISKVLEMGQSAVTTATARARMQTAVARLVHIGRNDSEIMMAIGAGTDDRPALLRMIGSIRKRKEKMDNK